jgi:sec-independent protein translocase protein TatB
MFDIGWGELLLIGVVALVVIGPKELPGTLRTLGQWMTKIRRMAGEFQNQFQEAIREAELHDLKKEVDEMAEHAAKYTHFDPIEDARRELEKAAGDLPSLDAAPTPVSAPAGVTTTSSAEAGAAEPAVSTDTNSAAALLGAPTTEAAPLAAEAGPAEVASASLEPVAAKEAGKEPA